MLHSQGKRIAHSGPSRKEDSIMADTKGKRGRKASWAKDFLSAGFAGWKAVASQVSDLVFKTKNPETEETVELTANVRAVDFGGNLATATAFFGGEISALLNTIQNYINDDLKDAAKRSAIDSAFGVERKVTREYENVVLPAFVSKRGAQPDETQKTKLMAIARQRVTVDLGDDI